MINIKNVYNRANLAIIDLFQTKYVIFRLHHKHLHLTGLETCIDLVRLTIHVGLSEYWALLRVENAISPCRTIGLSDYWVAP